MKGHIKNQHIKIILIPGLVMLGWLIPDMAESQEQRSLSPEEVVEETEETPENWEVDEWYEAAGYATRESPRSDYVTLVLRDDDFTNRRYHRQVPLTPRSEYRLSYWIKTDEIKGRQEGAGTGIRLGDLDFTPDEVFQGTNEWTYKEITFSTENDDSMVLEFLLGKQGEAKGEVWVDEIYLERIATTPLAPSVTVDLSEREPEMSEYIYGQFIEHMGNSIYRGMWSEMLGDRKFYYVPDTENSPWHFSSDDPSRLVIDSLDAYAGNYTPLLRTDEDSRIEFYQENIALEASKEYEGRIVVAGSNPDLSVDVVLSWGDEEDDNEVITIDNINREYQTLDFSFNAENDTGDGRISVIPNGEGMVHIGTLSLMPADNIEGFRPDVIELMKQLDSPIYRWPGGNFVSGYNWKDGIGERDKRPPRLDHAWAQDYEEPWMAVEHNDVGIHEFMKLCDILDTEPFIAVNTGLGSAKLAAGKVEYLNGSVDTPMGQRRAENGHPEPFEIRYFAVGNEMYGEWQLGFMPMDRYMKKHRRVSEAMWEVDPGIKLIAVGEPGEWNRSMLGHNAEYMDYISMHFYRQDWHGGGLMTHVFQIPEAIQDFADELRRWHEELDELEGREIEIALDEWNFWYGPHIYGLLGTRYFLRDALGIAAGLNAYLRNSDVIYMANYAQTVNVIGAIKATETESFLAATGVVLKNYRRHFGTVPVETTGDSLPFDIASSLTEDGNYLTISVINPTGEMRELELDIIGGTVNNEATAYVITGEHDMVYNEIGNEDAVSMEQREARIEDNRAQIPAVSATILEFEVEED